MKVFNQHKGEKFAAYHADCIEFSAGLPADAIDFSIYSPPFANLFVYSESERDLGNVRNEAEFCEQYKHLVLELYRATRPGRLTAVHCSDLPRTKSVHGHIGLYDFPADIRRVHEECGWTYHSRITIWKDPVVEMQRTKALGLLYKQLQIDATRSRQGMPDYVLVFRKTPSDESECDKVGQDSKLFPVDQWQQWASPVWMDIDQTNVLNARLARADGDERHVCVAEGSLVLTRENGYVPIETISLGDKVLTHEGRWRPVTGIVCNGVRPTVHVRAHGVANLIATPNHQLWARLGRTSHAKKYAMESHPEWIRADSSLGSYLNLPLPPVDTKSRLTADEWWIVGRWLGDGHRGGHRTSGKRGGGFGQFIISCAHSEAAILITRLGAHAGHTRQVTATQIVLIGMRRELRDVLRRCGEGAQNKKLPAEAFSLNKEMSEALLSGYLSADGHHVEKHNRHCASSISRALLLGVAMVAQRARGVVASVYAGRPGRTGEICGRSVTMRQDWILSFRNSKGYRQSGWIGDDGAWKKVRSVSDAGSTRVWDIKVGDDASFVAEGAVVHNCPLQLDLIERAIRLWSNPGDAIYTPFMGIGSEIVSALKCGRYGFGTELKPEYFKQACKFLEQAEAEQATLFEGAAA